MKAPVIFITLFLVFFTACRNNSKEHQTETFSDSVKYVQVEPSTQFQTDWSIQNQVVYQWLAEPDLLHPTNGISAAKNEIFLYLHSYLVMVDLQTLELTGVLADKLPEVSNDGLTMTFHIRKQAKWDDGSAITTDDVLFTIKAGKSPLTDNPHQKPVLNNIAHFIKNTDLSFTIIMKKPYIHNVAMWADLPIIQKHFFDPDNLLGKFSIEQLDNPEVKSDPDLRKWADEFNSPKFGREPAFIIGAGAYRISQWLPGQSITLVRKNNYWAKNLDGIYFKTKAEKIIFKVVRDPNAVMLELLAQSCDVSSSLSSRNLLQLRSDSLFNRNFHSRFIDSFFYTYAAMNNRPDLTSRKKLFNNREVRKAMALLTPVDEINRIVNQGINKRMTGPVSFLKTDFNPELTPIPFNPDLALQLLEKAGWKDHDGNHILDQIIDGQRTEFEFSVLFMNTVPEWRDMALLMADSYRNAGMKPELIAVDYPEWISKVQQLDFDLMLGSWGQSSLPDDFTQIWHSSAILTGSNFSGFGNAKSDALIDSIKTEMDDRKRMELSFRFQQIVYDEQPVIFLFASVKRIAVHKRFGGIELYYDHPGILLNHLSVIQPVSVLP